MSEDKDKPRGVMEFLRTLSGKPKEKDSHPPNKRSPESESRRKDRHKRYDSDGEDDEPGPPRRRHGRSDTTEGSSGGGGGSLVRSSSRKARARAGPTDKKWPPEGVLLTDVLPLGRALGLVSRGVPIHKGHTRPIPNAPVDYYLLATTTTGNKGGETDAADLDTRMLRMTTMRRVPSADSAEFPWDTLEQPSYGFHFGYLAGTITLTQWAAMGSRLPQAKTLSKAAYSPQLDTNVTLRDVDLVKLMEHLTQLETVEEENEEDLYRSLYRRLLRDPDRATSPHKALERQISDLTAILSRPDWIDFSAPRNQIVTRFIFVTADTDPQQYLNFFHQLALSMELDLRINHSLNVGSKRERLMSDLLPCVQWSLALARRWRENIRIEKYGTKPDHVKLHFKRKNKHIAMLKKFAKTMSWPNLKETSEELGHMDKREELDTISSHALAFFSGLVLPGPTWPFILMCTLIDVDPDDKATKDLTLLLHTHPHCGFQYRNSHTYWSTTSIMGKVLAPTGSHYGGWIGPCQRTDHLGRTQIARIRSHRALQCMPNWEMPTMTERSDPMGPAAELYPVSDYLQCKPQYVTDPADSVHIDQLCFKAIGSTGEDPRWFEAGIRFTIDSRLVDLRLKYDVSFVSAWPCSSGAHPLFGDFPYRAIRVDDVMSIQNWGLLHPEPQAGLPPAEDDTDREKVLVIEAFGSQDNEVFARAWCAHWGLGAVVADLRRTCMACAVRETYAATLLVLILIDSTDDEEEDSRGTKTSSKGRV